MPPRAQHFPIGARVTAGDVPSLGSDLIDASAPDSRKHGMSEAASKERIHQFKRSLRHKLRDCNAIDFVCVWASFRGENERVAGELAERWGISVEVFHSERMSALWTVEEEMRRAESRRRWVEGAASAPSAPPPSPPTPPTRWVPPPRKEQPRSRSPARRWVPPPNREQPRSTPSGDPSLHFALRPANAAKTCGDKPEEVVESEEGAEDMEEELAEEEE